jgi:hypothetical protein
MDYNSGTKCTKTNTGMLCPSGLVCNSEFYCVRGCGDQGQDCCYSAYGLPCGSSLTCDSGSQKCVKEAAATQGGAK